MSDTYREPSKVVADVLAHDLGLDDSHCLLGDQAWSIPPDQELFVVVYDDGSKTIGMKTEFDQSTNPPEEVRSRAAVHDIRIEIMSLMPGNEARTRKDEVAEALVGFYAQELMEKYGCQISHVQPITNATDSEAAGRLLKYVLRTNVTSLHRKTIPGSPYYDKFNGATEDGSANPPEVTTNE